MKKMKALFLTLALGFTFVAAATAVACNKGDEAPATSSDWFGGEQESLVSLRFDESYLKTYQYESFAPAYSVSGTASKVEFSSSDESIATVDGNGVVTTKGVIGKVIITATVEGVSATCELDVEKSPYAPEIVLDKTEYTIEAGETLEFNVKTEWNKTEMEDVEYAVSFAENSQNTAAQISVEGDTVKVVSAGAETIDVIVSTTVRGIYTSKVVAVEVKESVLTLQAMNTSLKPYVGKYTATISTTNLIGDMANSVDLSFAAVKGGKVIDGASIAWEVNGDAAVVEDGKLVGKKRGSVTVTGTVEHEGETATVEVACEVLPPEVHLEETYTLEIENIQNTTMKVSEKLIGKLQNAELNGKIVSSQVVAGPQLIKFMFDQKAVDAGKRNPYFPMSASQLGNQQLVINTDLVRYTMDIEIYTMIINNAAELDKMKAIAHTGQTEFNERYQQEKSSEYYDGYFILGNDIDYNKTITSMTDTGSVWWCQGNTYDLTRGFKGVFDGRGYNIDGVTVGTNPSGDKAQSGGIFGYISKTGVVKNVSFTNATLLTNQGFICSAGDGTIENVSISYKKIGGDKETTGLNSSGPRIMGSFFTMRAGSNANVKNCLIDASAADITLEESKYNGVTTFPIHLSGAAENVENVIVLCPNQKLLDISGADVKRLTYNEVIAEDGLISTFDKSIWTTVEGIPMFVNQANNLDRDAAIEFINVDTTLVAGFEMLVLTNNPYVKIEVEEIEGVKFESSILTATDEAFTKEVTLTATSLLNPSITATHTVYIDSFGKAVAAPSLDADPVVYNSNPVLSIGDNSWKGDTNYVYFGAEVIGESEGPTDLMINWEKLGWGKSEVTVVSIKNGEREHFVINVEVDYVAGDFAASKQIYDSAFSSRRANSEYSFTEVESDVPAPEGYKNVTRLDCNIAWSTALAREFWHPDSMSAYSDLWFAMRIVNGRWVMQEQTLDASAWVYFHYTQTSEGVWAVEVKIGDSVHKVEHDVKGLKLQDLLYRSGWSNGFLLYNNNQGEKKDENGVPILPFTTSIYATEVYAIEKA